MRFISKDERVITQIKLLAFFDSLLSHFGAIKLNPIRAVEITYMMLAISICDDAMITRNIAIWNHEVTVFILAPSTDDKSWLINNIALLIKPQIKRSTTRGGKVRLLSTWREWRRS